MYRKILLGLAATLVSMYTMGQSVMSGATFYGKVTSEMENVQIMLKIYRDPIAWNPVDIRSIPVDSTGGFHFFVDKISSTDSLTRITLQDISSSTILINKVPVKAGDSILLSCHIDNTSLDLDVAFGENHPKINYSGRGAARYLAYNAMDAVPVSEFVQDTNYLNAPRVLEKIIKQKIDSLDFYRNLLEKDEYYTAKIDLIAKMKAFGVSGKIKGFMEEMGSSNEIGIQQQLFKNLCNLYPVLSDEQLAASPFSDDYLDAVCVREMMFKNGWKPFMYDDYYDYAKANRKGIVLDKVIGHSLLSENLQYFYNYNDYQHYDTILQDAFDVVKTPFIKKQIKHLLKTRKRGAAPYDFNLPADSSKRMVRLSDFKGKVVLVDMWGYICTGCYMFANTFHKEVYPLFKDNPNFKVISILKGDTPYENYLKRLRNEIVRGSYREPAYTFPEYINLFAGQGIKSGKQMEDYYQANIAPFILLIGKDGKIYSSRVPFFINNESPNVNKLIALIKKALNEPV